MNVELLINSNIPLKLNVEAWRMKMLWVWKCRTPNISQHNPSNLMWKLEDVLSLEWKLVKEIMTMNVDLNVEAWRCSKFGMEAHEGNHDHECRTLAVANKQLAWYYLIWAELSQFCSYPQSPNYVGKRLHTNLRNIPLVNPTWIT